jgi:hypothetical protein
MANPTESTYLSDEQQRDLCAVLLAGCDRETAARYAGCLLADFHRQLVYDRAFASRVRRAEAACELRHMGNVSTAADEIKNWRASVWWLDQRSAERRAGRDAHTITARELTAFVRLLATIVDEEVRDAELSQRLSARFAAAIQSLADLEGDEPATTTDTRPSAIALAPQPLPEADYSPEEFGDES